MFAGVTYNTFLVNVIVSAEFFLLTKSPWVVGGALLLHLSAMMLCLREPRFFDLWILRVSRCPRVRNFKIWGCNSYRP